MPELSKLCAWHRALAAALFTVGLMSAQAQEQTPNEPPASRSEQKPADELARIGDRVITRGEVTSYTELLAATEGAQWDSMPGIEDYVLQLTIGDVYTTVPLEDKQITELPFAYKNMNERSYLKGRLREKLRENVKPTDEQMQKWYTEHVDRYTEPERVHAHHLFMAVSADDPSSSPEQVRKRILEVKQEADKGTSFGLLAQKHSEAASSASGGDIGVVTYRMPIGPQNKPMNIVLDNALFKLKTGQVSDVLQTSHGLHLVYAKEHHTTRTPSIDDLKTSRILPGALENDLLTSSVREAIAESVDKHNGKVTFNPAPADLTTATEAFKIDGKKFTVHHLEQLYGPRFTQAYNQRRDNPDLAKDLMRQVMEDEAHVLAAIDAGIPDQPDAKRELALLKQRAAMRQKLQAIVAQDFTVTEEQTRKAYEEQKEQFRQNELGGVVLVARVDAPQGSAEAEKAKEQLRKKLDELHKGLTAESDLVKVVREAFPGDDSVTASVIERHVPGTLPGETARYFDQTAIPLEPGKLSDVVELGNALVITQLKEKVKSEPIPYDRVAPRMKRQLQLQNEREARQQILRLAEKKAKIKWAEGAREQQGESQ